MSKVELIERIMRLNRTARRDFLLVFSEPELEAYLKRLETAPLGEESYGG